MHIAHSHLLLDACCVLNFCASSKLLAILKSIPAQVAVTQVVRDRELKTLSRLKEEENEGVTQFEAAIGNYLKGTAPITKFGRRGIEGQSQNVP